MLHSSFPGPRPSILLVLLLLAGTTSAVAQEKHTLHSFDRHRLTSDYYSEGISSGDLNADGHADVVHGPFWFAGPDFKTRQVIYGSLPQNRDAYAKLEIELNAPADGECRLEAVFTQAKDYAIIQLHFNGEKLGRELDLFDYPNVTSTGVVEHEPLKLVKGKHTLGIEIISANSHAIKKHIVGIDYLRLVPMNKH